MADDAARQWDWRELVAVALLSVTAVLTAWSGFQASKWGGAMSISFSKASTARIETSTLLSDAAAKRTTQIGLGLEWLKALNTGDDEYANFLRARFPVEMKKAVNAWEANGRAGSPFSDYPEDYVQPELLLAEQSDARADAFFSNALEYNARGDVYTLLTVLFATVLFFIGMGERFGSQRAQTAMVGVSAVLFTLGLGVLLAMPKLVG